MAPSHLQPAAPQRRDVAKVERVLSGNIPGTQKQTYTFIQFKNWTTTKDNLLFFQLHNYTWQENKEQNHL